MIAILHTLGEGEKGLVEIIILIVVVFFGIIGSMVKKNAEKKRMEEANRASHKTPMPNPPRPVEQPTRLRTLSAAQQAAQSRRSNPHPFASAPLPQASTPPQPTRRIAQPHEHDPLDDTVHRLLDPDRPMRPAKKKPIRRATGQVRRIVANAEIDEIVDLSKTQAAIQVNLSNALKVKQAFVLMEILSPPIAMKNDRHSWDI